MNRIVARKVSCRFQRKGPCQRVQRESSVQGVIKANKSILQLEQIWLCIAFVVVVGDVFLVFDTIDSFEDGVHVLSFAHRLHKLVVDFDVDPGGVYADNLVDVDREYATP